MASVHGIIYKSGDHDVEYYPLAHCNCVDSHGCDHCSLSLAFLEFFTWECYGPSNSIASAILYIATIVGLIGGIVPAVMMVRKVAGKYIVTAIALSIVVTLALNSAFMYYTLNIC